MCQHWNAGRRYFRELRSVTAAMPWDHIQFDLITSLTDEEDERLADPGLGQLEGDDLYKYVLVVVDVMTGFVILRPLRDRFAEALTRELWDIFMLLGVPKIVQSDNES